MPPLTSLAGFAVREVLSVDEVAKTAAVAGTLPGSTDTAVVRFARAPFDPARVAAAFSDGDAGVALDHVVTNDIYSKFRGALPRAADAAILVDVIHPATEKHVAKYRSQN